MTKDEKYMMRCIQLARNGICNAAPNPMVGAVIVYRDRIIGEGYHVRCGEAHAEVNAIRSVKDESLLNESTIYVSLEPCSHYGKTPPCADLIIRKGIRKVVIGCKDPFALVDGNGIQKLRQAGIEVVVGVLEEQCRELIKRFITFHVRKRPYILLKWAESSDGFMDCLREDGEPVILSSELTSMEVHKLRAEYSAILIGKRTALLDNPSLTTRHWSGKNPVRLVIDKDLSLPRHLHIFDGKVRTIIFTQLDEMSTIPLTEFVRLDFSKDILPQIMNTLYEQKLQSLIVEGGSKLLQSFIDAELWDEARIEISPVLIKEGVRAPVIQKKYVSLTNRSFGRIFKYAVSSTSKGEKAKKQL